MSESDNVRAKLTLIDNSSALLTLDSRVSLTSAQTSARASALPVELEQQCFTNFPVCTQILLADTLYVKIKL